MLFETVLILGGSLGNAEDLLEYPLGLGGCRGGSPGGLWTVRGHFRGLSRHVPWRRP